MFHRRLLHDLGRLGALTRERAHRHLLAKWIIRRKGPPLRERTHDVFELARTVKLRAKVLAGRTVRKFGRDFFHPEPLVEGVDREARFHAPTVGEGLYRIPRFARNTARATQRLHGLKARGLTDAIARRFHNEAHACGTFLCGEDRDRHVHVALEHRIHERLRTACGFLHVSIDKQQRACRLFDWRRLAALVPLLGVLGFLTHVHDARAGRHSRGLAAIAAVAHHDRPGALRQGRRGIRGTVVDNDNEVDAADSKRGGNGLFDTFGLVLRGDHDSGSRGPRFPERRGVDAAHRRVTSRATIPPRARRSRAVSGSSLESAASKRLRNSGTSFSTPSTPKPFGRSHTGIVRPSARNEPT